MLLGFSSPCHVLFYHSLPKVLPTLQLVYLRPKGARSLSTPWAEANYSIPTKTSCRRLQRSPERNKPCFLCVLCARENPLKIHQQKHPKTTHAEKEQQWLKDGHPKSTHLLTLGMLCFRHSAVHHTKLAVVQLYIKQLPAEQLTHSLGYDDTCDSLRRERKSPCSLEVGDKTISCKENRTCRHFSPSGSFLPKLTSCAAPRLFYPHFDARFVLEFVRSTSGHGRRSEPRGGATPTRAWRGCVGVPTNPPAPSKGSPIKAPRVLTIRHVHSTPSFFRSRHVDLVC